MAKVLFVEDHPFLIEEIVNIMINSTDSIDFDRAENLEEAWKYLVENEYNLIVLDVMLPGLTDVESKCEGIYLAKWIVEGEGIPDVIQSIGKIKSFNKDSKMVFLTSRNTNDVRESLLQLINHSEHRFSSSSFINRSLGNAYDQAQNLLKFLSDFDAK